MAEELFRPWTWKAPEGGAIGKRRLGRRDGMDKASGKGLYSHDIYRPGMLYAKVLLSPYPHARIKSMDTSKVMTTRTLRGPATAGADFTVPVRLLTTTPDGIQSRLELW